MKINVLFFSVILLVSACSTSEPTKITTLEYKKVSPSCFPVARVLTEEDDGVEATAILEAEDKVRSLKGDTLVIEEIIRNGKGIKLSGVAYRCKKEE
jgi:hypothetical protein